MEILRQAKALAKEYCDLTGKPLGVTAEVGEFEAARLLGLTLCAARETGHDALRALPNGGTQRVEIKTVRFDPADEAAWRIGTIDLAGQWTSAVMVLLDLEYEPREIWEADRASLLALLWFEITD